MQGDVLDPLRVVLRGDAVLGDVGGKADAADLVEDAAQPLRVPHPTHLRDPLARLRTASCPQPAARRGIGHDPRVVLDADVIVRAPEPGHLLVRTHQAADPSLRQGPEVHGDHEVVHGVPELALRLGVPRRDEVHHGQRQSHLG